MSKDGAGKFASLPIGASLLAGLEALEYHEMTPVQASALPSILSGRDVIGQSKTGSGKTAAFGIGLLTHLDPGDFCIQSLVLCPTRELASQVSNELRRLARHVGNVKILALCGGAPFRKQADSLAHGAHVVVGTPGRIEDHLRKKTLDLGKITVLVLDEADRMLDMGFRDALERIVSQLPAKRQTMLFSATFPEEIESMTNRVMRNPELVRIDSTHDSDTIDQFFFELPADTERLWALRHVLTSLRPGSALVFCNTKSDTDDVTRDLRANGFAALALHGDMLQRDRDQTLVRFANGSASVLVATDVAARGLDIDSLDAVINYSLASDSDTHLHRIGRTGRAGSKGIAVSLVGSQDLRRLAMVEECLGRGIKLQSLPPAAKSPQAPAEAPMATILIDAGKKQKIRPGDILGALTGETGVAGGDVGKIDIFEQRSFVAVRRQVASAAIRKLRDGKLKGRSVRARLLKGLPDARVSRART